MTVAALDDERFDPQHVRLDAIVGWREAALQSIDDAGACLRLLALPQSGRPLVDAAGSFGGLAEPTGLAVDRRGTIYVLDRAKLRVKRYDPCCQTFATLPCLGGEGSEPRRFDEPTGLAIGGERLLVVEAGNRRVQVLSLPALALLAIWGPIDGTGRAVRLGDAGAWSPFDARCSRRADTYVTDRANGLVHRFDCHGRWLAAYDGAGSGAPLQSPTHLAIDAADRLYIVQDGRPDVVVLGAGGEFLATIQGPAGLARRFRPGPVAVDPDGNLYVADSGTPQLWRYVCPSAPGTAVQFVSGSCETTDVVSGVAFDAHGDPLATVPRPGQIVRLTGDCAYAPIGTAITAPLDSGIPGCQWHRVLIDGVVPEATAIEVHTYCDDVARGDDEIAALAEEAWSGGQAWTEGSGEWDCLVLSGPGQYLWLRLRLVGTGRRTPAIDAIRVYFPRLSSLQYLPATYQATQPAADFLARYLSVFDTVRGTVEQQLDAVPSLFDPWAAPDTDQDDMLGYLAAWLGIAFDASWDELRRRRLVASASQLYRMKGTPAGLLAALRIFLGLDPAKRPPEGVPGLLEGFVLRRWLFLSGSALGDNATLWGKRIIDRLQIGEHSQIGTFKLTDIGDPLRDPFFRYAHRFTVFFPAACCQSDGARRGIERAVTLFAPAHTEATVEFVEPRFSVGIQATIGLDSAIGAYPAGVELGVQRLGSDSVLTGLDARSPRVRIGTGTVIGAAAI